MPIVPVETLRHTARRILKAAGTSSDLAAAVGDSLDVASRRSYLASALAFFGTVIY